MNGVPSTGGGQGTGGTQGGGSAGEDTSKGFLGKLDQSTAQTLAIQEALLNHNLTVGPAMAAKSASEDSKKV
jgi:hypothetical protein